jgi:Do/DeqQ family serine protease
MKKYLIFFVIAIFSAVLSVFLYKQIETNNLQTERSEIQDNKEYKTYQTKFNPSTAVNGPDFRIAAKKSVDAVVHIRSQFQRKTSRYDDFFGSLRDMLEGRRYENQSYSPYIGYGSGVIIAADGYIVTNNHVVEGASKIEVTLNDKRLYEAELIGTDPSTDLALIKIIENKLPYLIYGNSDELEIGEWVLAIGNPFNLTSTVTAGIVSAKARNINILGSNSAIESFIQTDAAVNRGNSGGALVNNSGYLVGVNAAIASQTGAYEGYSFAIPVNIVKKVMDDLLKFGEVQRAYIGVSIRELTADFAKELDVSPSGVYVSSVTETGGAALAGIKDGDIITSIESLSVNSTAQLLEVIGQHRPGDKLSITVLRDGSEIVYNVILQNENGSTSLLQPQENFEVERLGAAFGQIPTEEKNKLKLKSGVKIKEIKKGLLLNGGVREGFIVLRINNILINSKKDIELAIANADGGFLKVEGIYPDGMRIIYGFEL